MINSGLKLSDSKLSFCIWKLKITLVTWQDLRTLMTNGRVVSLKDEHVSTLCKLKYYMLTDTVLFCIHILCSKGTSNSGWMVITTFVWRKKKYVLTKQIHCIWHWCSYCKPVLSCSTLRKVKQYTFLTECNYNAHSYTFFKTIVRIPGFLREMVWNKCKSN